MPDCPEDSKAEKVFAPLPPAEAAAANAAAAQQQSQETEQTQESSQPSSSQSNSASQKRRNEIQTAKAASNFQINESLDEFENELGQTRDTINSTVNEIFDQLEFPSTPTVPDLLEGTIVTKVITTTQDLSQLVRDTKRDISSNINSLLDSSPLDDFVRLKEDMSLNIRNPLEILEQKVLEAQSSINTEINTVFGRVSTPDISFDDIQNLQKNLKTEVTRPFQSLKQRLIQTGNKINSNVGSIFDNLERNVRNITQNSFSASSIIDRSGIRSFTSLERLIDEVEEEFTPIRGNPGTVFTIQGTDAIPGEVSDFIPLIVDEEVPTDPEIPVGPTGPPGPEGFQGATGPPGDGGTWDSETPTTATDFAGIPSGTVIELGTSSIDILKSMLYPVTISFTSFDMFFNPDVNRYYHIGDTIPQALYQAKWTLSGGDDAVEDSLRITQGGTELFTGGSPTEDVSTTFSHGPYGSNTETTITFTVAVTGGYNDTVSRDDSYYWRYPMYAGKTSGSSISSSDLSNLLVTTNPSNTGKNPFIFYSLATMRNGITLEFPGSDAEEFLYWAVPKAISGTSSVTTISNYPQYNNQSSFTNVTNPNVPQPVSMNLPFTLTATNYGVSVVFDVYQSNVAFAGSVSIQVKEV